MEAGAEQARQADGCLDFSVAPDLLDPGRVNLFERWESRQALDAFRKHAPRKKKGPAIRSASVLEYDVADVRKPFSKT